jgi:hypothetical protein
MSLRDAAAFRTIAQMETHLQRAIYFHGVMVRMVKFRNEMKETATICEADYPTYSIYPSPKEESRDNGGNGSIIGPLGEVIIFYNPNFQSMELHRGELLYLGDQDHGSSLERVPLRLFSYTEAQAVNLGDLLFLAVKYPVLDQHAVVGDSDSFRLIADLNNSRYNMPVGEAFQGPAKVNKSDEQWLSKGIFNQFEPMSAEPLDFGVQMKDAPSSPEAKVLISAISMLGVQNFVGEDSSGPSSKRKIKSSDTRVLLIVDLRKLERHYGALTWARCQGFDYMITFEYGDIRISAKSTWYPARQLCPELSDCFLSYPYLLVRGKEIRITLNTDLQSGKPGTFTAYFRDGLAACAKTKEEK